MSANEAHVNQVLDLFTKFSLERLSDEWVTNVIDADFTEVEPLPVEFEEFHGATNFSGLFNAEMNALRRWVDTLPLPASTEEKRQSMTVLNATAESVAAESADDDTSMVSKFWVDFAQVVKVKNLMSFVFYHVHTAQRYDADSEARDLGTQAGSLYLLVLCIPGSNAFRLFHPVLYLKALDILRLTTKLHVGASSPSKGRGKPPAGGGGGGGLARANSQRRSADEAAQGSGGAEDADEEEAELTILSPEEANKLTRLLNVLLSDFIRFTQRFSLKHSPESLDETISILVEVTRSETHNAHAVFLGRHGASTVTSLVYNSYVALQCICSHLHGRISKIVTLVLKHTMNNILMTSRGTSDLSVRALGVIRDHSVIFVKYLLMQIKEPAYEGVYILVQHLCARVPDKADFRQKTSQSVVEILRHLPIKLYTQLMKWFFKFSHNEKAGHRLFTLEIISRMLCEEERHAEDGGVANATVGDVSRMATPDIHADATADSFAIMPPAEHNVNIPANRNILSHKFLLGIIFSRCRDSAATVRSKALGLLAECTLSENPTIVMAMQQIFNKEQPVLFTTPHIPNNEVNLESPLTERHQHQQQREEGEEDKDGGGDGGVELPNATMVIALLRRRTQDDKVTVRKSALQVIENLMKLDESMVTSDNLKVFCDHCRDPALLIRKQMVTCLTQLVERYPQQVAESWVRGVLPAILDPEMKVSEKVVEMMHRVILSQLVAASRRDADEHNQLPWLLLASVTRLSFHKFLKKAISVWAKSSWVKPEILEIAKSHIGGEHNEETWLLLSLVSHCLELRSTMFAVRYYHDNCARVDQVGWYTLQQVVRVLCNSVTSVPETACSELREALLQPIAEARVGAGLIPPIMDLLALITTRMSGGDEQQTQAAMHEWVSPLLRACDEYLQSVLFAPLPHQQQQQPPLSPDQEEQLFRRIFLLGEAGLLHPGGVNKRMFLMLQSMIFQGREGAVVSPPPPLHLASQTQSTQPPSIAFHPSKRIQAVSVAVLGKLCLQHESQAKRIIPALGCMLDTSPGPDIKTNIIFVLSDMCVRYATVVDPLMPQVTSCLRDPDLQVRRTTLTLLISLLQEDYLKLKGSFFYRILQCLCDEEEEIRDTVVFFLTERLLNRFPKVFSQHFIECIFHYNCYEEHESYNRFAQNQQEKELFSLAGPQHFEQRMRIYKFMLDHMADDQRFSITQRLCHDVLGGVVDGRMGGSAAGYEAVLRDTLHVLSCDEIKLASLKARPEDDQATSQEEQAQITGMALKKTIISQVVKRNVIENIVPILIALKHRLEEQQSPLMKHLLLYLKEIMRDYKNEVKEILAGDKQLAEEIEFDLRKLEERQREEDEKKRKEEQARLKREKQQKKQAAETDDDALPQDLPNVGQSPSLTRGPGTRSTSAPDASSDHTDETSSDDESDTDGNTSSHVPTITAAREVLSPKRPAAATKISLLKTAVRNSQNIARRSSLSASAAERGDHAEDERRDRRKSTSDGGESTTMPIVLKQLRIVMSRIDEEASRSSEAPQEEERDGTAADSDDVEPASSKSTAEGTVTTANQQQHGADTAEDMEQDGERSEQQHPPQSKQQHKRKTGEDGSGGKEPAVAASASAQEARRLELLRAISTPTRNQSILKNVTFMNQTQEVSAIGMSFSSLANSSHADQPSREATQETILMHLKSPEAYAKDEQFSRLRRSGKRSSVESEQQPEKPKESAGKKSLGGLFESVSEGTSAVVEASTTGTGSDGATEATRGGSSNEKKSKTKKKKK